jgi:serine/threonine-protein kinase RsbW
MPEPLHMEILKIASSLDELSRVDTAVERIAHDMGFAQDACSDLGICVTEVAANAISHAHHQQAEIPVEIRFEQFADSLKIVIRDHGPGFDVDKLPDPTLPENLMKETGRGVHLIRALMDHVKILRHPDGMEVVMVKYLAPSS